MMRDQLDTGDNMPIDYNGLQRAGRILEQHGWNPLGTPKADRTGRAFTVYMIHVLPTCQISLVAKPSAVWKGIVSVQLDHLKTLAEVMIPLVMHIPERGGFFWFEPLEALMKGEQSNVRLGVEMWNFPVDLGVEWQPWEPIMPVTETLGLKREHAERLRCARLCP
jgi:hypothetical protein